MNEWKNESKYRVITTAHFSHSVGCRSHTYWIPTYGTENRRGAMECVWRLGGEQEPRNQALGGYVMTSPLCPFSFHAQSPSFLRRKVSQVGTWLNSTEAGLWMAVRVTGISSANSGSSAEREGKNYSTDSRPSCICTKTLSRVQIQLPTLPRGSLLLAPDRLLLWPICKEMTTSLESQGDSHH